MTTGIVDGKRRSFRGSAPHVFKEFASIINGERRQVLRIRVLQYPTVSGYTPPMLDIREFIKDRQLKGGRTWTGYSSNGISFTAESCEQLYNVLPAVIQLLKEKEANANGGN